MNESQTSSLEGLPHALLKHVETLRTLMSTMDEDDVQSEEPKGQAAQVIDMEKMVSMPLESIEYTMLTSFLEDILGTTRR